MPRDENKPQGISKAAIKGAMRASENNEAPMGGGPVAFPAPSAQPTRRKEEETERPAKVEVEWTNKEDDENEWRRAGGDSKGSKK
jgi:hypothetical protein